ncbi:MAG: tryptophan-rich sensory protein [Flavobacterium sp.]|jgi:tryptophan-rich sensory protein|uniref:Tryptophan-rich sensory protein n=1 Tax=Flavobacterium macrobrachii TaxID=591204 RepID=A0ABS2D1F0_9FLAO|nr:MULTISPECIES: TspO/MBR family protein [Flavobacterium]MBM6500245.1 tryptophan-rich sensory protein [Flavobacterium macrobrachii]MCZ8330983.1 tryptophan-rich sensory protein [Flavobacterium sp.]PZO31551.1 MAG: sensory protein TspO [Flavobacteriaceae bacterium]
MQKILRIATVILTCLAVGYISSIVTRENIPTWYADLNKPFFNPPNWIFAPVWTLLYVMMGFAAGRVWNKIDTDEKNVKKAFLFFIIQLALNALWSYLFFGLRNPMLASFEIILLWLMIYETYLQFKKLDKISGYLLLPYLAWVSFATVLTFSIWYLNR